MELSDFIIWALSLGLLCLAWSLMMIFWPPDSESATDSELDSEATPKGE